ncbi:MAG: hypothetical protein SFU55_02930 [Methylophilus sp.]|nr:hypothetical protein [Methylophilus sp.]
MSNLTVKKVEKIKVLDQMMEDFAGDEFDDYEEPYSGISSAHKHYSADEDFIDLDDDY